MTLFGRCNAHIGQGPGLFQILEASTNRQSWLGNTEQRCNNAHLFLWHKPHLIVRYTLCSPTNGRGNWGFGWANCLSLKQWKLLLSSELVNLAPKPSLCYIKLLLLIIHGLLTNREGKVRVESSYIFWGKKNQLYENQPNSVRLTGLWRKPPPSQRKQLCSVTVLPPGRGMQPRRATRGLSFREIIMQELKKCLLTL